MVSKDFDKIIKEIKIADENAIHQKEAESFTLQKLSEIKEDSKTLEYKIKSEPEKKLKEEEPKNEIKIEEEPKNEIKPEKEEGPKEKTQKKKKKHNKKKSKKIFEIPKTNPFKNLFDFKEISKSRFQDNSIFRLINNWEEKEWAQTNPPTKDIDEQFPTQIFPQGEIQPYSNSLWRSTDKEKIELEKTKNFEIESFRKGAECHRQIRKYAQSIIRPNMKLLDICIKIENMLKFITNKNGILSGQSFPTGMSLNNCAAHYSPNSDDDTVLTKDDVLKLDFGTHFNGYVIDTAIAFDSKYDNLLKASKEATNTGIKLAGIDMRLCEIGEGIAEVINSYEVELNNKVKKIKPVRNLCGHTVGKYKVHAGKSVPCYNNGDNTKMEENEFYAIETFASTGKGEVERDLHVSHYMLNDSFDIKEIKGKKNQEFYSFIYNNFNTLAWCKRWIEELGFNNYYMPLRQLINQSIVEECPALYDVEGSFTSQFEHTFMLKPTGKEIFTVGDDY